jgi:hypothetical protein
MAIRPRVTRVVRPTVNFESDSIASDNNTQIDVRGDNVTTDGIIGKVAVKELLLVQKNGNRIDLSQVYAGMEFFEDIYSSTISGTLTINDFSGGLEKFYISGGETLIITVTKVQDSEIIFSRNDLVVYRVGGGEVTERLTTRYTLSFTTLSYVNSMKTKIFKSYYNKSVNEIAKDIYTKSMKATRTLKTDDSLDIPIPKPFVCTGLTPIKALEYLTKRACSIGKFYAFFERLIPISGSTAAGSSFSSTHVFGSLSELRKKDDSAYNIVYAPSTETSGITQTIAPGVIRASQMVRLDNFNHIDHMMYGAYHSKITALDPISRTYSIKTISYAYDNQIKAEENEYYPGNKILSGQNAFASYSPDNNEYPGERLITSTVNDVTIKENWLKHNIYGYTLPAMFRVQIVVDGSTNKVSCGDSVKFRVPSKVHQSVNGSAQIRDDEVYSGYYMVLSVRHTIIAGSYTKRMEMGRASLPVNLDTKFSTSAAATNNRAPATEFTTTTPISLATVNDVIPPGTVNTINNTYDGLPVFGAEKVNVQDTVTVNEQVEVSTNRQTTTGDDRVNIHWKSPDLTFDDQWYSNQEWNRY